MSFANSAGMRRSFGEPYWNALLSFCNGKLMQIIIARQRIVAEGYRTLEIKEGRHPVIERQLGHTVNNSVAK